MQSGGMEMIIKNAIIHDAVNPEPYEGDLVIENGKLVHVGSDADCCINVPVQKTDVMMYWMRQVSMLIRDLSMRTAISDLTDTAGRPAIPLTITK